MKGNGNNFVSSGSSSSGSGSGSTGNHYNKTAIPPRPNEEQFWICSVCTLHNPQDFLCCDACGVERNEATLHVPVTLRLPGPRPAVIDLTNSPPKKKTKAGEASRTAQAQRSSVSASVSGSTPAPPRPPTWRCEYCTTEMERQWWTCSNCGQMKFNSR
jgi:hypothetical protein